MILLRRDCLVFKKPNGEALPASAQEFAVELIGEALGLLDEEVVKNAAEAVLHYYREELGQTTVTIGEFSASLEKALHKLGFNIKSLHPIKHATKIISSDLQALASQSGLGCELIFFSQLRNELRTNLGRCPEVLRYRNLRDCVKYMLGAKKWNPRCQALSDQIVEYLRTCLEAEREKLTCSLLVC